MYQMKLLAIFYSICTVLDWVMFLAGRASVSNNDLICYKKTVILVNTNLGGLYMLAFSILAYIYATFMWYVFYNVPRSMGLVTSRTVDDPTLYLLHASMTLAAMEKSFLL